MDYGTGALGSFQPILPPTCKSLHCPSSHVLENYSRIYISIYICHAKLSHLKCNLGRMELLFLCQKAFSCITKVDFSHYSYMCSCKLHSLYLKLIFQTLVDGGRQGGNYGHGGSHRHGRGGTMIIYTFFFFLIRHLMPYFGIKNRLP